MTTVMDSDDKSLTTVMYQVIKYMTAVTVVHDLKVVVWDHKEMNGMRHPLTSFEGIENETFGMEICKKQYARTAGADIRTKSFSDDDVCDLHPSSDNNGELQAHNAGASQEDLICLHNRKLLRT
jgi:hypothetical protein